MTELTKLAVACSAALAMAAFEAGAATGQGQPVTQINVFEGAAATAAEPAAAATEEEGDHSFSANVALVSNYMFRGISQTDNGPAIQGGFDYTYNPFNVYLGVWGSNVDSEGYDGASMEIDVYGGWRPTFGSLTLDLGVVGYLYPNTDDVDFDTVEYKAGATYDFGVAAPGLTVYYSPDWFNADDAWRYELSASIPLPADFKLVAKYGWNDFDKLKDYDDWSVGVTKDVLGVTLGLTYTDVVDLDRDTDCVAPFKCDGELVFSISKVF